MVSKTADHLVERPSEKFWKFLGDFEKNGSDCRGGTPIKTLNISQSLSKNPTVPPTQRPQATAGIT